MTVRDTIWVEKYRPETLDDIVGNDHIVEALEAWAETGETPHVLLSGPAGCGKTAIVQAFARDYFGDDWQQNLLELNASDDRGIDVVREQIKTYANQGVSGDYAFKLIFLDEVDSTTKDAQNALRRTMEDNADTTRFFLSCNYVGRLIDPIQSRCVPYAVSPLDLGDVEEILHRVADGEDLDADANAITAIAKSAEGDARKAINMLQAAGIGDEVTLSAVEQFDMVSDDRLEDIVIEAFGGDLGSAQQTVLEDYLKEGVDSQTLAKGFLRVLRDIEMPEDARILAIDKLAKTERNVIDGAHPHIQWSSFIAHLCVVRHLSHDAYRAAMKEET